MAQESGVATPTIDDLVRLDRKRKGKKLSNEDWTSPTDPDAKIAKMKNGSTRLGYKPEHALTLTPASLLRRLSIRPTKATRRRSIPRLRRRRASWPTSALRRRQTIHAIWSPTRHIIHAMA
jgi:hypothetical protein